MINFQPWHTIQWTRENSHRLQKAAETKINKREKKIHETKQRNNGTTEQRRYSNNNIIIKIAAATDGVAVALAVDVAVAIVVVVLHCLRAVKTRNIPIHFVSLFIPPCLWSLVRIFCLECLCTWHLNLYVFLGPFNLISSNKYRCIVHDVGTVVPRSQSVSYRNAVRHTYAYYYQTDLPKVTEKYASRVPVTRSPHILYSLHRTQRNKIEKYVSVCRRCVMRDEI